MGVNLMLMSLTTPVHLLTPQSANGIVGGAHREGLLFAYNVNAPHSAHVSL